MKRWILALTAVLLACFVPGRAAAACISRLEIALADGTRVCLSDHPLGELQPIGHRSALKDLLPRHGVYTLAMHGNVAACPVVAVLISNPTSSPRMPSSDWPQDRADRALSACNAAVRAAGGSADCACTLVAADGQSSLNAREFAERARSAPPVAARTQPQAAAAPPGPQTQPTSTAGTAAPVASPPNATVGPSTADFAALRQQIESLQTQVSRQGAAAAQPPVSARPAAPKLRARALVVGNGAYASLGALGNPRNDAEAIAERLRKFGVEVDLVLDAGRSALVKALTDYQTRAAGSDLNILFYAGHGLQVGGINYLAPIDLPAENATVGSVKFNALSLNDVLEYLSAPTRLVFLDACRDNPLSRSLLASRSTAGVGLAPVNTMSGTLVAYATKDGSTAEDGRGRHSPYTSALLQHLDAEEDIAIVLRRVRQAVLKATNNRQEPWEYGSLIGDQLVLSRLGR